MGCSSSKYEISNIHNTCPICFNMIYKKVITPCNHHFCKQCLQKWCNTIDIKKRFNVSKDKITLTCPLCRKSLEDCYKKRLDKNTTLLVQFLI